jgi:Ca2+:H+ antiporter
MAVASVSLIIPATLYAGLHNPKLGLEDNIVILSRGTAVILLILYTLYLYFQLVSHASLFNREWEVEEDQDERHSDQTLSPITSGIVLVIAIALTAVCANSLVGCIDSIVETKHISKTFIGLILLPMLGNATERITAVAAAYKGKMDLAINVAIGGSMQIALFVTPFLVVLSWVMQNPVPMTLHFQSFETVVIFLSVLVVNYLIQDGKSNYLEGAMCLGT